MGERGGEERWGREVGRREREGERWGGEREGERWREGVGSYFTDQRGVRGTVRECVWCKTERVAYLLAFSSS